MLFLSASAKAHPTVLHYMKVNGIRRVEISPLGPSGLRFAQNDAL